MHDKVNNHIHESLQELYYECVNVVREYEYCKRSFWVKDPKEYALSSIGEQEDYIKQMAEVFQNAELITNSDRILINNTAYRMRREATRMLREHIRKMSE